MTEVSSPQRRVLFYTGDFTHPMYRELFACPPDTVQFIPSSQALIQPEVKEDIKKGARFSYQVAQRVKWSILNSASLLHLPLVKTRKISAKAVDSIHSAQYLLLNDIPWVVDFEDITTFVWYRFGILKTARAKKKIKSVLASRYCRHILPWTEAARRSLINALGYPELTPKVRVIYPCIRPRIRVRKNGSCPPKLLFVGGNFYQKGGLETLLAFERLGCDYGASLTVISNAPPEIKEKYRHWKNISFKSRVSLEDLEEEFKETDIFVLPVHTDTFGFVFLEAFARGIPCLSTRHFAVPEIITDGETGLLIECYQSYFDDRCLPRYDTPVVDGRHDLIQSLQRPPKCYIDRLAEAMDRLLRDSNARFRMGELAYKEVESGRFSIAARRDKLKTIYDETICH